MIRLTVCLVLVLSAISSAGARAADGDVSGPQALRFSPPQGKASGRTAPGQVQARLNRGSAVFGTGFEALGLDERLGASHAWPGSRQPLGAGGATPALPLGMRYRVFGDAPDTRSAIGADDASRGKTALELEPAKPVVNVSYGGLGMRLADDTRLMLRPRHGGLGLIMRTGF